MEDNINCRLQLNKCRRYELNFIHVVELSSKAFLSTVMIFMFLEIRMFLKQLRDCQLLKTL
jgi:hypothetical protein